MEEEEKKSDVQVETSEESSWKLGELVWARVGSYPFWPSVITQDVYKKLHCEKKLIRKSITKVYIHVNFLADKGRYSWVPESHLFPFKGKEDFDKRASQMNIDVKKKDPKYYQAFFITNKNQLPAWEDAILEAKALESKNVTERLEYFAKKVKTPKLKNATTPDSESKRKRKQSFSDVLSDTPKRKKKQLSLDGFLNDSIKIKTEIKEEIEDEYDDDNDEAEEDDFADDDDGSSVNGLGVNGPLTPPSSSKDSSDESCTKKKFKIDDNVEEFSPGVFEIFYERNKSAAKELDPVATDADIKKYLLLQWENMPPSEQTKYRADYLLEEDLALCMLEDGDNSTLISKPNKRRRSKPKRFITDDAFELEQSRKKSKADKNNVKPKEQTFNSDLEDSTSIGSSEASEKSNGKRKYVRKNVKAEIVEVEPKVEETPEDLQEFRAYATDLVKKARQSNLFKGFKQEKVCQICETPSNLIKCKGPCHSYYHLNCVKPGESSPEPSLAGDIPENKAFLEDYKEIQDKVSESGSNESDKSDGCEDDNFKCIDCLSQVAPPCFICNGREEDRIKCSIKHCGKHYHPNCLKSWPQSQWIGNQLTCPYHNCHICTSDNPQYANQPRLSSEKFVSCVRCPSNYHAHVNCLPAGSVILTASQIICPRHYKSTTAPINTTWCFLCTEGGTLICCDTCPMSFHTKCLGIDTPDGDYMCEDCETGRMPLYGELVWVKHGAYRWWPAIICHPVNIPSNIESLSHKPGEFCVMFLGTRDYNWVHRGRAFRYEDGDTNSKSSGYKKRDTKFNKALDEAKIYFEVFQSEKTLSKIEARNLKPPPYKKIKVNKPVGNIKIPEPHSFTACECDKNDVNPCSDEADCLNRILMIECNPEACPAGTKCQNQLFAQRKYPSMSPFHTEERGWGLKTLEKIFERQFIIEYVGEIIDEAEYRRRLQIKKEQKNDDFYFLTIDNSRMIDAEPKGNLSRFMNHSCQPNCETQKWTVNGDTRIGLFALRDIEAGEELTFNYNLESDGETKKPCMCRAPNCSGFIGLKVQKQQQIVVAQQKKLDKVEKAKKQRRSKKNDVKNGMKIVKKNSTKNFVDYESVPICSGCCEPLEHGIKPIYCKKDGCDKVYHENCIVIEDGESPVYVCPWHLCAECYKTTDLIQCVLCCNAFCTAHTKGCIGEDPETKLYICYKHTNDIIYEESDSSADGFEMGEGLMDFDEDPESNKLNQLNSSMCPEMSAASKSALEKESPPRVTIVEQVNTSSDADESLKDVESTASTPHQISSTPKTEENNENAFTMDQIQDIIGILK